MNISKSAIHFLSATVLLTCCKDDKKIENPTKKPNFILIQADDLGFDDLGMHGNQLVETPDLNAFAKNSLQFNNFYVNPVCAASRASLLTGRNFLKTGVAHVHGGKDYLALNEVTIAEVLKSAGYVTGMWGKWHTGKTEGYLPWQRGFDEAFQSALYKHRNHFGWMNGKKLEFNKWADEVLVDYAIDFIERNKDTTFFAYLPLISIHGPLDAPEELVKKYEQKGLSKNLATIYAMVKQMDIHLARLFKAIDEIGLAENTIIMFMSDNGPAVLNADLSDEDRVIRYVNKFRGHKGNVWENGVKSPLFIQWKNKIAPGFSDQLLDVTDIFPTMASLAGADLSELPFELDGKDFSDVLFHPEKRIEKLSFNYANIGWPPTDLPWTDEGVKNEYRPVFPGEKDTMQYKNQILSVRNQQFKLLINPGETKNHPEMTNGVGLFDILNDPRENNNLAAEKPEIRKQLESDLKQWYQDVLHEKNAYRMATFVIGANKSDVVNCNSPVQHGKAMKNTAYSLKYWKNKDFADYKIMVKKAGKYRVHAKYTIGNEQIKPLLKLKVNENAIETALPDPEKATIGEINLSEGLAEIRVSLHYEGNNGQKFESLKQLVFEKIE